MWITSRTRAILQLGIVVASATIIGIGFKAVRLAAGDDSTLIAQVKPTKPSKPEPKPKPPVKKPPKDTQKSDVVDEDEGPSKPAPPVEYETVKLANGTEIQIEKWGETFEAYDYRPAPDLNDKRVEEIIGFRNLGLYGGVNGMQVDSKGDKLYWAYYSSSRPTGRIMCSNLDGKQVATLVDGLTRPRDVVLDIDHHQMYWLEGDNGKHSLKAADLNGKHIKVVLEGLDAPFGLTLDRERGELYYWENPGHIVRVRTDGTGETQFVTANPTDSSLNAAPRRLFWHPKDDCLYWVCWLGKVQRAARGQPLVETLFNAHLASDVSESAFTPALGYVFIVDGTYGSLLRSNLNGTEREVLATGVRRASNMKGKAGLVGSIAVDEQRKVVYFTGNYLEGSTGSCSLFRMKLVPRMKRDQRSSPPLITAIQPDAFKSGAKITIRGQHLSSTKAVVFVDDSTVEHLSVPYQSHDDDSLTVTVPELGKDCHFPLIIVETASGVTMTLRRDLIAVSSRRGHIHDRLKLGPLPQVWLSPDAEAGAVESAVVYANSGADVALGTRGKAVAFVKNGAWFAYGDHPRCLVYHEPFARMGRVQEVDQTSKFIPVSAIRPSFMKSEVTYMH